VDSDAAADTANGEGPIYDFSKANFCRQTGRRE
jgi:hypothetical protein